MSFLPIDLMSKYIKSDDLSSTIFIVMLKVHTCITKLLAKVPMRRGPANGSTHVANIKNRNSHPDNANQRKKIVYKWHEQTIIRWHIRIFTTTHEKKSNNFEKLAINISKSKIRSMKWYKISQKISPEGELIGFV